MKKLLIILLLLPNIAFAKAKPTPVDYTVYHDALILKGITFINEPRNQQLYFATWEALDQFNTSEQFRYNLNIKYQNGAFTCGDRPLWTGGHLKLYAGCFTYAARLMELDEYYSKPHSFQWLILHEYGHSTGLYDETEADNFANQHLK